MRVSRWSLIQEGSLQVTEYDSVCPLVSVGGP